MCLAVQLDGVAAALSATLASLATSRLEHSNWLVRTRQRRDQHLDLPRLRCRVR